MQIGEMVAELLPFNDFDYAPVASTLLGVESSFLNRLWAYLYSKSLSCNALFKYIGIVAIR